MVLICPSGREEISVGRWSRQAPKYAEVERPGTKRGGAFHVAP